MRLPPRRRTRFGAGANDFCRLNKVPRYKGAAEHNSRPRRRLSFFHAGPAPKGAGPRSGALRDGLILAPGMKVGLFGGSFNPAHDGHAHVAETAMRRLGLDRVVWLVSPQNPLKDARHSAPLPERMASARAHAHGPSMIVSDFESRAGTAWTVDTLRLLVARHPGVHFVWLMDRTIWPASTAGAAGPTSCG